MLVLLVLGLLTGADPNQLLALLGSQAMQGGGGGAPTEQGTLTPAEEAAGRFASVVLADTEDVWNELFREAWQRAYQEPTMVLFSGEVESACGYQTAAVGPFYCPADSHVYIDLSFFDELATRFGAAGDFAQAYVIAHEVGHHVQNLLGTSSEAYRRKMGLAGAPDNEVSVRVELQADFLAGVWAHHTQRQKKVLEAGDLQEALNAAGQIGDDTLQRRSRGRVAPDLFTHGTAKQRVRWFRDGFETGDVRRLERLFTLPYDEL